MRNVRNWILVSAILVAVLSAGPAFGGGEIFPTGRADNMPVFPTNPVGQKYSNNIKMSFHGVCYAVNLRAHVYPLAADGCLNLRFGLVNHSELVDILIPARYMDPLGTQVYNPACRNPTLRVLKGTYVDVLYSNGPGPNDDAPVDGWSIAMRRDPPGGGGVVADVQTNYAAPKGTIDPDGTVRIDWRRMRLSR